MHGMHEQPVLSNGTQRWKIHVLGRGHAAHGGMMSTVMVL